ncbi:MAG: protein kinase [Blastocatellales bacterium]
MIGQTISRYRILSKIGSGGMGEVYLAEDISLGRKVAIKILPERFTLDDERVRRFEQEARSASGLNHPNIITIYEIGQVESETGKTHFIATEFIEGETLRQRMTGRKMSLSEALEVAIQCANALQAAHSANIAHRDIKPENIMLRPDGYVKLLDFGLAKLTERNSTGEISSEDAPTKSLFETQPGMVIGTVAYMSPEQARGQRVDGRTDIFSLGIVLYEMISGRRPFSGATTSDMIAALLVSEPTQLSEHLPAIPKELEDIVNRTLIKDRDQRYQFAQEVANDLKRVKARLDLAGDSIERGETALLEPPTARLGTSPTPMVENRATAQNFATNISNDASTNSGQTNFETNISPIATAAQQSALRTSSTTQTFADTANSMSQSTASKKRNFLIWAVAMIVIVAVAVPLTLRLNRRNAVIDSIAVLPFVNVNADMDAEYLSDGITESLINTLSQVPEISVSSRNSVIRYKGKEADARKVAEELEVKAVLLGRMMRRGDELTINAELVDGSNGRQIWGERYRRKVSDLLALQEEIAQKISDKLKWRLTTDQKDTLGKVGTQDSVAYELYLKGRYYWNQGTPEALKKADEFFEAAAGHDPAFADAFGGCAACHAAGSDGVSPQESMEKAKLVALKTLKIDDSLSDAHLTLATINFRYDWEFATAEREFKRAIELDPKNIAARQRYAEFLALMGRHKEANAEIWKARSIDPNSLPVNQAIGAIQYYAKEYDHAVDHLKKTLAIDDNFAAAHTTLGLTYEQSGKEQEAVMEILRAKMLMNADGQYLTALKKAFVESKAPGFWRQELDHLTEESKKHYIPPTLIASLHTRLGENEQALAALEKGLAEKDGGMVELKVEPVYEPLRSLPKFNELLRRIGLGQ